MTIYYVATTGLDSNNGTSLGTAFLTIGKAATVVVAGDTVNVQSGTYNAAITTNANGTPAARIVFQSAVLRGAKITAPATTPNIWTNNGNYVDIVGFEVDGTGAGATVGLLNTASFCSYRQNYVHAITCPDTNQFGAGIFHNTYTASDNDTIGNLIGNIGTMGHTNQGLTHGIYHTVLRGNIWNNICYQVTGWGIQLWHGANNVVIANNLTFETGLSGLGGIVIGAVVNEGTGICANTIVANNIIQDVAGYAIVETGSTGTGNQFLNNLIRNYVSSPGINVAGGSTVSGTLNGNDPLFVNYQTNGSGDYHLQVTSPCIGAGSATGMPFTDYDGKFRSAAHASIGPYAFYSYAASPFLAH